MRSSQSASAVSKTRFAESIALHNAPLRVPQYVASRVARNAGTVTFALVADTALLAAVWLVVRFGELRRPPRPGSRRDYVGTLSRDGAERWVRAGRFGRRVGRVSREWCWTTHRLRE